MYGNGIKAYQKTDVITADPKRLVIMCYEEAIRSLKVAKGKYLSGEYEAKAKAIQKAQDIITELLCALDFEKGGRIAKNLEALYNYMMRRILAADVNADVKGLDEVAGMLQELRDAWQEVFYGNRGAVPKVTPQLSEPGTGKVPSPMYG